MPLPLHLRLGQWFLAALLAVLLCSTCFSQVAPPKTGVSGRITNQAGDPLGKANVTLTGNNRALQTGIPPTYTTASDSSGTFTFEGIEANTYRLVVQRPGYLDFFYSQADGTVIIPIADGEQKHIDVKMIAPSFISGKITDEDGEPFPGARVNVFRINRAGGKQQLQPLPAVAAGPGGSFSIGPLSVGRYYLAAASPGGLAEQGIRQIAQGKTGNQKYVTTYFPASLDISGASLINLPSETVLNGMDIRLRRASVFHISGKVAGPAGESLANPTIRLLIPGVNSANTPSNEGSVVSPVDGAFEVNGLLPGIYILQSWSGANRQLQCHQSVTLSDRDLDNVVLALAPALDIPLSVRIEDADPQQDQKIRSQLGRFTLTASDGLNANAMARSEREGKWLFANIGSGVYRMGLGGPDGTYVKSIRFRNQDITKSELDTNSGGGELEMVLSPHAAEITGVVHDASGQPLSGANLTLWEPGLPPAGTLDQARSTRTDAMGSFRFGSLRPGEYRIAAWEQIETGMPNIPEFHVRFDSEATVIKLTEDAHETVQPVLISREKIAAAAAALQ